ncbi:hypothetical protein [Lactococcus allomyrinae]|uniref:Uncharacterized protein n=1 Tax=Lactococcus allomyrinae TaxID=2419773 RepID=A0A387BG52_9LACT|nr:hypothetical protein [Lactococcus allomyrinae]AYG01122.1 hypothetical protein D7I46_08465 [Lactococcus allomyrinae]
MGIEYIYILSKRFIRYMVSLGKRWYLLGYIFIGIYSMMVNDRMKLSGKNIPDILSPFFSNTYPLREYSEIELPYFWLIIHLISMLLIFYSLVVLIDNQGLTLLIRIKQRNLLSLAILISIFITAFIYTLVFGVVLSVALLRPVIFSYLFIKYLILLWLSVTLTNLLSFLIYIIGSNTIVSMFMSTLILIVISICNTKFIPFKSSLILSDNINYFLMGNNFCIAILINIFMILMVSLVVKTLIQRYSF